MPPPLKYYIKLLPSPWNGQAARSKLVLPDYTIYKHQHDQ